MHQRANRLWTVALPPTALIAQPQANLDLAYAVIDVEIDPAAPLLRLADAFWWAARQAGEPAPYKQTVAQVYKRAIRIAYKDPLTVADLAIDGTDLEKLGVKGPAVGNTLRKLLEGVINDPRKNTYDQLLTMAKGLL